MGCEMKVIDSIPLIKMAKDKTAEQKEWLAEHEGEYDDLVQMRAKGREEAKVIGCMFGYWKESGL